LTPENAGAVAKSIEVATRYLHRVKIRLFITISLLKIGLIPWFLAIGVNEIPDDRLGLVESYPSVE